MFFSKLIIIVLSFLYSYDTGYTSHYDPHVMSWQVDYHDLTVPCEGCAIAVSDCGKIGDTWWIRPLNSNQEWVQVVVADCAGQDAYGDDGMNWMDRQGIICELSYPLAERFDTVGRSIEIEVLMENEKDG